MKKIALTSMLAVFAASSAMAAHVSNPLYIPAKGEFYSITDAMSATNRNIDVVAPYKNADMGTTGVTATETFGYGFTNWLSASINASASTQNWFELNTFNDLGLGLNARVLNHDGWVADIFGGYEVNNVRGYNQVAFDKDNTEYTWTAGVRGGYTTGVWTVAAHAAFDYTNSESFNWDESFADDVRLSGHYLRLGLDGQLYLTQNWNVVAGAEYNIRYDANTEESWSKNGGYWKGTLGINYDFNPCSFVGAYVSKIVVHDGQKEVEQEDGSTMSVPASAGNWDVVDGFIFGAKFGVKF